MQSTAALKTFINEQIEERLAEELSLREELMSRLVVAESLLGRAYAGFHRISSACGLVRNSGGSARTNLNELMEAIDASMQDVIQPMKEGQTPQGFIIPENLRHEWLQYQMSVSANPAIWQQEYVADSEDDRDAIASLVRDD